MAKRRGTEVSTKFLSINPQYEEEVLEVYAILTEEVEDLQLKQLRTVFKRLQIPKCFTADILQSIDHFYESNGTLIKHRTPKSDIVLHMVTTFTISSRLVNDSDIIDIVDVDKLISYTSKLLYYRDNYTHIKNTWRLFVETVLGSAPSVSELLEFKLNLVDLKKIKSVLGLDGSGKDTLSDVLLIDMLSCCSSDESGTIYNFDFSRATHGLFINIKDFACILGNLGEYD
ncbi:hypothetical protein PSN45_000262 [Yamadazyma tenuis]|uniref:Uncharacterized protein n=1 Tax=Candida tenuis (strain ATCC 10573 / BCRC 21748 / CBS 615 / JCM 9827 / NBRC 10315 / NRRL Y-1498 / VKM Y-70) TaxID=590646 RepID=G3B773_CANTC|nr:uncharacterized protein CANTEDRAFT_115045 [Yamadazyma tenuis ATCC 10573]XP_006688746.1 uncharacterized protein CANTEDRAFT_115045 [Yamadazyma tenuis ATCC 10573]EGV62575.1 hypothetical protein CANTEDRAFT_115045 [Yamadazyma tenuis ATCC 10573]EGV62576.1 hypothetical protein CANTEDRAFT_115045 [Yamadazyma tenuis ATCC 10573]WEJ92806.1 hypothetical protein PSN45_000262 [Yamadazyma tenuis]